MVSQWCKKKTQTKSSKQLQNVSMSPWTMLIFLPHIVCLWCQRIGLFQTSKSARQHPPLIVRFSNRDKRNKIFKRKKMLINNEELNSVLGFTNIAINENLSDCRRMLYDAAIKTKCNLDYKFLWTNQGKIFLRQNSESKIICGNSISYVTMLISQSILPSQF